MLKSDFSQAHFLRKNKKKKCSHEEKFKHMNNFVMRHLQDIQHTENMTQYN